jgi:hypothetical protein
MLRIRIQQIDTNQAAELKVGFDWETVKTLKLEGPLIAYGDYLTITADNVGMLEICLYKKDILILHTWIDQEDYHVQCYDKRVDTDNKYFWRTSNETTNKI